MNTQESILQAISLKNEKRYDEAIQILSKCDQNDSEVLYHIGDIYLIFKYPNEALQCFENSLIKNPQQAMTIKDMGRAFMLKKEYTKAVNSFLKAYKLDQQQQDIFKLITMCYMENGEYDKAFVYANQQLARFPKDPDSYCLRGKYYLNTCKYEQSIDSLNICLKLRPNNAYALGTKGQAFMMLGKMHEGHQCLNEAISINPNIAELHVDIGLLFEGMSNIYLAILSYDQALQIQHDNPISIQRLYNLKLHQYQKLDNHKNTKTKLSQNYNEIITKVPQSQQYYIALFYTISNFLQGYLNVTDITKLNYQKQIGYIKNLIDINHQLGVLCSPISSFFRIIECYLGKTNSEIQHYISEWISQKYLKTFALKDFNIILSNIVGEAVIYKNSKQLFNQENQQLKIDHLQPIIQNSENQIFNNYQAILGLHDGLNMIQRMLIFCTPFLKTWDADFKSILINILCYDE
ncbi:unnamed protein product [Paramecium sonneborni]|uniref:Tetratricopeptide repeat protein n=1 Tax=Paramecium sonneborni TaxID=65129 RepID=A0A8S1QWJ9_9CILI|nr:unnamed protein product [Paramecium sonneborni]